MLKSQIEPMCPISKLRESHVKSRAAIKKARLCLPKQRRSQQKIRDAHLLASSCHLRQSQTSRIRPMTSEHQHQATSRGCSRMIETPRRLSAWRQAHGQVHKGNHGKSPLRIASLFQQTLVTRMMMWLQKFHQ